MDDETDIRQILRTMQDQMVTKEDIGNMATKDDIRNMVTKDDIHNMATKDDIRNMATKEDIQAIRTEMATQSDIKNMVTTDDLQAFELRMDSKLEDLRDELLERDRQTRVLLEDVEHQIQALAENVDATLPRRVKRIEEHLNLD